MTFARVDGSPTRQMSKSAHTKKLEVMGVIASIQHNTHLPP